MLYAPQVGVKVLMLLNKAVDSFQDIELANALLADPRVSGNQGMLMSTGLSMRQIKRIKESFQRNMPTLEAQKRADEFLSYLDNEQQHLTADGDSHVA